MNPWYLLYCKRTEQHRAEQHLKRQGIDCYYPQVTVKKIRRAKASLEREPLFPNYLFASFNFEKISFTTVRSTRGVVDFVRQGPMPIKVPLEILEKVRIQENSDKYNSVLEDVFQTGDKIDILAGQFEGAEAIFMEPLGEKRSILLINLLNQKIEIITENTLLKAGKKLAEA